MAWLTQLLTGGLLGKVTEIIKVFTGDRSKRESGFHEESIASREQFATEFRVSRGGIIESIMDALNRQKLEELKKESIKPKKAKPKKPKKEAPMTNQAIKEWNDKRR